MLFANEGELPTGAGTWLVTAIGTLIGIAILVRTVQSIWLGFTHDEKKMLAERLKTIDDLRLKMTDYVTHDDHRKLEDSVKDSINTLNEGQHSLNLKIEVLKRELGDEVRDSHHAIDAKLDQILFHQQHRDKGTKTMLRPPGEGE